MIQKLDKYVVVSPNNPEIWRFYFSKANEAFVEENYEDAIEVCI